MRAWRLLHRVWSTGAARRLRPLSFLAVAALSLLAPQSSQASAAAPANLVVNGGFERDANGDRRPDGWTVSPYVTRSGGRVHRGRFAMRHFARTNANYAISQHLPRIRGGRKYEFFGWVNVPATTDRFSFKFVIQWRNARAAIATRTIRRFDAPTDGWVVVGETLTAPAGATSARLIMSVRSLNNQVFVDDLAFQPARAYKLHGLNFSPYMDGQDPNAGFHVAAGQLRERMRTVAPYTDRIRSFGCGAGLERTAEVARDLGLQSAVGVWLGRDAAANDAQIACAIRVARSLPVEMVIVGSEVLLRDDLKEGELISYLNLMKGALPGVPVATAEVWGQWLLHPALVTASDLILVNYYPYWEGIAVDNAIAAVHGHHQRILAAAGGKAVVVSETGWPSAGNVIGDAVPSPENAAFYFLNFISWARTNSVPYYYFEAFDELWKTAYEGPQGAHWGVWDKDGSMKAGMQPVFAGQTMPDNWSGSIPGGPGTPEIELTHVPPYGSSEDLVGQVWHVRPADYRVAVYIRVAGGWWTKPTFAEPVRPIDPDGGWVCDITTGGSDADATEIAAYLVPAGYAPPPMSGGPELPAELGLNAVAAVTILRSP